MGANTATLSPFRYPGGKSSFLKFYEPHLDNLMAGSKTFVDVFAGGGSVACYIAKRYPIVDVVMNDVDSDMAAFWQVISEGKNFYELTKLIMKEPTVKLFRHLRGSTSASLVESAYRAIFFNRCTFSGIAKSGPLGGYEQKSSYKIDCRYNKLDIIEKVANLMELFEGRLTVTCEDFRQVIPQYTKGIYCDPPYYQKGKQLYRSYFIEQDHIDLKKQLRGKKFLLSYDTCPFVDNLWWDYKRIPVPTRYTINKGSTQAKGVEQLIYTEEK